MRRIALVQKLKEILSSADIEKNDYAIIAGYCMYQMRDVGDIDVIVSKCAFERLKRISILQKGNAALDGADKLYIKFEDIGNDAEIEFFEKENNGFPDDRFSLRNMQRDNMLVEDDYGNCVIAPLYLLEFYSSIDHIRHNKTRILKNIGHLKLIKEHYVEYVDIIDEKINVLEKLLN